MNNNRKLFLLFILTTLVNQLCFSQSTTEIAGAKYGAMSNSGLADNDVWQNLLNPAGISAGDYKWQVGAAYTNRFTLSELASSDLVASIKAGQGTFGLVVHSFGYDAYRQNQFSGAYAMNLNEKLRAGIQLNYYSLNIAEGYGSYNALTANVGFQYDFNENVSVGLVVKNPNRSKLSTEIDEYVQSLIAGGIKYKVADNLTMMMDLSKDLDMDPNFSAGLEYAPVDDWYLRGGISTLDRGLSFGFGYSSKKWSADLASLYHQVLGFSPMISFTYRNE